MKATNLGIWYVQIPNGYVINPMGEIVDPKIHNGSTFVLIERKRIAIPKLPHLNYSEPMNFKHIFYK